MTRITVPQYYPQTDSATGHGDRMCFSSTIAMAIKYLRPTALMGSNADDDYLRIVLKYGDTTNPDAHLKAIEEYGLKGNFSTTGSVEVLETILKHGRPVPVGWLHKGPLSAPGGGHWTLLTGLTADSTYHHDPYGEANMVGGDYVKVGSGGKNVKYSRENWLKRWTYGNQAWYLDVYDPTPKPIAPPPPKTEPAVKLCPTCGQPLPSEAGGYDGTFASVASVAQEKGSKWPRVVAAQWRLESGSGQFLSGKNNFFGIKGSGTVHTTQEYINGNWVTIADSFKNYESPEACIEDLVRMWYKDYKTYRGVNRATSEEECCHLLQQEGYATDPDYPSKLIRILNEEEK